MSVQSSIQSQMKESMVMAIDIEALDALRAKYQWASENVGQAWVEWWGPEPLAEVEAEKTIAGAAWLAAIHAAWPEILPILRANGS